MKPTEILENECSVIQPAFDGLDEIAERCENAVALPSTVEFGENGDGSMRSSRELERDDR